MDFASDPRTSLNRLADALAAEGWLDSPPVEALYVSSASDTKAITFTHPAFLASQAGRILDAPNFYVFVDKWWPPEDPLAFQDRRTRIETEDQIALDLDGLPASLLRVAFHSTLLPDREVAVVRVQAENEAFVRVALAAGWRPDYFIGVCDGCGAFGGNHRCENQFANAGESIPIRLGIPWWITDHLPGSTARGTTDPQNGQEIRSQAGVFPVALRQAAFLNTLWRSNVSESVRLHGGARLFAVEQVHAPPNGRPTATKQLPVVTT